MSRLYFFLNQYALFLVLIFGSTSSGLLEATENNTIWKSHLEGKIKELKENKPAAFLGFAFSFLAPMLVLIPIKAFKIVKNDINYLVSSFITALISCLIILFIPSYYYPGALAIWIIIMAVFSFSVTLKKTNKIIKLILLIGMAGIGVLLQYVIPELIYHQWERIYRQWERIYRQWKKIMHREWKKIMHREWEKISHY